MATAPRPCFWMGGKNHGSSDNVIRAVLPLFSVTSGGVRNHHVCPLMKDKPRQVHPSQDINSLGSRAVCRSWILAILDVFSLDVPYLIFFGQIISCTRLVATSVHHYGLIVHKWNACRRTPYNALVLVKDLLSMMINFLIWSLIEKPHGSHNDPFHPPYLQPIYLTQTSDMEPMKVWIYITNQNHTIPH